MTSFQRLKIHCNTWKDGCGSDYCAGANKVFYRGSMPCDILFIGEGPGKSENTLRQPFVGVSGKLLDYIITRSVPKTYKVGFTNIVSCIPRLEGADKNLEPDFDQIRSCRPRLEEVISIADPRLIFSVGSHARDALNQDLADVASLPPGRPGKPQAKVVHIVHPSWILRQSEAFKGLEIQRVCCEIRDALRRLENPQPYIGIDFAALIEEDTPPINKGLRKPKSHTQGGNSAIMNPPENYDDIPF